MVIWNMKTVRSVSTSEIEGSSGSTTVSHYATSDIVCDIPTDKLYRFYSSSGTFFAPLIVMTFVYVRIYMETKRRLRERARTAQKLAKSMAKSHQTQSQPGDALSANGSLGGSSSVTATTSSSILRCFTRLCPNLFSQVLIKNAATATSSSTVVNKNIGARKCKSKKLFLEN